MVSKIFEILSGIKKTSHITESAQAETVNKIVKEVETGSINPVEAYVMLDYLSNVVGHALNDIKAQTLNYIKTEGENQAFNIQLGLVAQKEYAFQEDKDWNDITKKISIYKDALGVREKFLSGLVNDAIKAEKTPPISYTTSINIVPKPLSNT